MESELSRVVDALPGFLWTTSLDGQVDYLSRRWCEYTGLTLDESNGRGWQAAIQPDDLSALLAGWQRLPAPGVPVETEARVRGADREYRWFLFSAHRIADTPERAAKLCGMGTNIDHRKLAEEALGANDQRFRSFVDGLPVALSMATPDGELEQANRRYLEYFGGTLEELKAREAPHDVHPDDRPRVLRARQELLDSDRPYEIECRRRRADGVYRWFSLRAFPLRDSEGRVSRWYRIQTDIDDRKRAEEALRQSETFLAEGQRISSTGTYAWSGAPTERMLLSDEFYRIFEYDRDTPVTFAQLRERFHPEDLPLLDEKIKQIAARRENPEWQIRLRMPDGRIKYVHVMGRVIHNPDGRAERVGAVQDVTRRQCAEDALNKVRTELSHVTRVMSLGALTASIAHEVNQPLAGIVTNSGTCLRMLAADPPNIDGAREAARRAIRDGNRAAEVIGRLHRLFSKQTTATEMLDLSEATREVIALFSSDLQRSRVILRTELDDGLPLVTGDRVQLQQVIMNLIRNAADAMGEVDHRPRQMLIRTNAEQDCVSLAVTDTGVGLEPESAEKLFDAFYTTKSGGMGIGLSISRSIIESHGGRLWAKPNDGPGVTFSFVIPRQAARAEDDGTVGVALSPKRPRSDKDDQGMTKDVSA
jgi:PAS domain S-box-containing protein